MVNISDALQRALDTPTTMVNRAVIIPGDLRAAWRIAALLMLLDRCHGRSATLEQVHVIGSAMLNEGTQALFSAAIDGERDPDSVIVRYDPAWARAVDLAVGLGLAEWTTTGRVALTTAGRSAVARLWTQEDLLSSEGNFLRGLTISQAMIDRILEAS